MKFLLPILAIAFTSCVTEIIQVEYHSTTMMGRTVTTITPDSVIVAFNGRSAPTRASSPLVEGEWASLLSALENIDLNKIADLKAPSDRRFTDAAPYGKFVVVTKDSTYTSAAFDGGNPPSELVELDKVVQDIAIQSGE